MRNILKAFAALMILSLPLSAQAKNTLPEAVKQIQQKVQKYRPTTKVTKSMTRASEATLDSIITYFGEDVAVKTYITFDGEWHQTVKYLVSLEDDSLIKSSCEKVKESESGIETINYGAYEEDWYPLNRSVTNTDGTEIMYYIYDCENWVLATKYTLSTSTTDDGNIVKKETVTFYEEDGSENYETSLERTLSGDKVVKEVYYGSFDYEFSTIYPLVLLYEYDDNNLLSKVLYVDEFDQLYWVELYTYDSEEDYTKVTLNADSVMVDRYIQKAVGDMFAYTYERSNEVGGELVLEEKVEVDIAEDGSYVITETDYDEEGNPYKFQQTVQMFDEEGHLVLQVIYSATTEGEWELTNSEANEYINGLLVKTTSLDSENDDIPTFVYYYYNDGTHTGIEEIAMPESQQTGLCFDLQGRAVTATANGLVVRNGKVVLIRN